ncbi:TonB-dependent receptor [Brevundimonas sp.]|uniref:TonB-dependent receptor n=1 Tax=Brevundimonas sp. TaxID=1871086 RepID=UPI003BA88FA8
MGAAALSAMACAAVASTDALAATVTEITDTPDLDQTASTVAEVIVTAERRETRLLRTPGSITPVGAEELRERRIEGLNDLSVSTPGLSSTGGAPQTSLFIRGIGTSDPGSPPSVGIYVDDIYNPRAFGNNLFDLPDVQSVQVLRGPQGTLYGQNTTGGAIKITSRNPTDQVEGSALVEVGNYNALRTQAYLSGPLVQGLLSGSVAVTSRQRDGYTYNRTLDYWVDDANSRQARFKLRFTPNDRIEAVLAYTQLRENSDTQAVVPLNYGEVDPRVTYSPRRFDPSREVDTYSLHVSAELNDHLTLRSITAYRQLGNLNPNDASGLPDDRSGFIQYLENDQTSQEFQLLGDYGRFNFVLGAVYRDETFTMDRNTWSNSVYSQILSDVGVTDTALYGQLNYNITDRLRVTVGGRYSWEEDTFDNALYRTDADFNQTSLVYSVADLKNDESDFSPKLGLDYQVNDYLLTYASWSRGSKAGGFNRSAANVQIAAIPVSPEIVTAYEIGAKGRTPNNLLSGSFAVFYNDFEDYQATITNPIIGGELVSGQVLVNAAQARTYGAELEATLRPFDGFEWRLSAAWLDAKFDSFANPTGNAASDFAGNWLPFASEWIAGTSAEYRLPLAIPGELSVRATVDYRSPYYSDNANREEIQNPEQINVNLGATYVTQDDKWTFLLLAKNLFDDDRVFGYRVLTPTLGVESAKFVAPRLVTLSARYAF